VTLNVTNPDEIWAAQTRGILLTLAAIACLLALICSAGTLGFFLNWLKKRSRQVPEEPLVRIV